MLRATVTDGRSTIPCGSALAARCSERSASPDWLGAGGGPSQTLRKWFGHDPGRWDEFRKRYFAELTAKRDAWMPILEAVMKGNVTLLFSAHDSEHNNAVALREFLRIRTRVPTSARGLDRCPQSK